MTNVHPWTRTLMQTIVSTERGAHFEETLEAAIDVHVQRWFRSMNETGARAGRDEVIGLILRNLHQLGVEAGVDQSLSDEFHHGYDHGFQDALQAHTNEEATP